MKPKSTLRSFLALTGSSLLAISYSHAANLYWDGADSGTNAQGGVGTWVNGGTLNWDTLPFGGADSVWTNGADTAVFGGTAGTATIGAGGVTVGGLTFNTSAYTVAAGSNGLTFSSGTNKVWLSAGFNGSPNAIISGTVAGTGANLNFVANPGAATTTLTFSATSAGGWTGSTTIGPSKIVISDSTGGVNQVFNNTSAININGGALMFRRNGATNTNLVSDSAAITVNGGGSLVQANLDAGNANAIETVGAVTVNSGQFNFLNTNGGSSGSRIDFNGLTVGSTAAVTFNANAGTNNFWRNLNGGSAPANTPTGEILGAWATFGGAPGGTAFTNATQTDYAVYTGANGTIAASGITASAESTWSAAHSATSNYTMSAIDSGTISGGAGRNLNTLRSLNNSVTVTSGSPDIALAGHTLDVNDVVTFSAGTIPTGLTAGTPYYVVATGAGTIQVSATKAGIAITPTTAGATVVASGAVQVSTGNNLGTFGILNGSATTLNIIRDGAGGSVTLPTTAAGNLFVTTGAGAISIAAPIINNTGALTLVKSGTGGTLTLSGANSYTGGTVVNAGTLTFGTLGSWVSGQNLTFGGTSSVTASVTALTGGTLTVNQGATGSITGTSGITFTSTSGAGQIIYGGGGSATLNIGDASLFTGNAVLAIGIGGTNPRPTLRFSSIGDTAGSYIGWGAGGQSDSNQRAQIELNGNGGALTFDNRQLVNLGRTGGNNAAKSLILGNNNSNATHKWVINTDFLNQGDRGGQGLIFEGSNSGDNAFNGVIGNSTLNGAAMNVYKTGAGKWILGGNNTFTGRLIAGQGTLSVGTLNEVGVAGPLGMNNNIQLGGDERTGVGASNIELRLVGTNSGTLEYTGAAVTSSRSIFIGDNVAANTGGGTIANNGTGAITFSAATFNPTQAGITATRTLFLGGSYAATTNEIQGIIQDNVSATGKVAVTVNGGVWKLSGNNTHDGLTQVSGSATMTLSGDNSLAGGGVTLNTAGTGASTPRLNLNSATALGSGTLNFGGGLATDTVRLDNTAAGLVTVSTSNVFTLNRNFTFIGTQSLDLGNMTTTLGGMTTGNNRSITVTANTLTLGGSIGEAVANLGISKAGAGTLVLAANCSYTGATAVTAGTLALGANDVLPNTTPVTIGNATLDAATFDDTVGTLTVTNAASTINLGSGANLSFATGSPAWTGTLNLTGTLNFSGGPSSSLRFGTTTAGLTVGQLAAISAPGWSAFALDIDGYLTATASGNTNPTISDIANQSIPSGGNTGALAFTVGDAETAVGSLSVSGSSSNLTLVPNANIVFGGSGASRTVTVTPVSGLVGSATITVTVTDGGSLTAQDTFTLTVTDNYLSWATANGVTGGEGGDHDNDGAKNLVEYALVDGGERGVLSGNTITFTKRGVPYGSDLTYIIETSETLVGAWTDVVTHGPGLLVSNPTISYTFTPGTPVKKFARLEVLSAP